MWPIIIKVDIYLKYVNVNRCVATGCKNACLEIEISIEIVDWVSSPISYQENTNPKAKFWQMH